MGTSFVPWSFLDCNNSSYVKPTPAQQPKVSFADTLKKAIPTSANACHYSLNQLPEPCLKGDDIAVHISEEEYLAGLEDCKTCLHARLLLPKGSQPLKYPELKAKVTPFISHLKHWRLIPLGKGYFELAFDSVENMRQVLNMGSWNLNPGVMRLFSWSKDFNPYHVKHTSSHCWIRMYGIPREYWRPKNFFSIARAAGIPIAMDDATRTRAFGQFARILVDIDLAEEPCNRVLVERPGYASYVDLVYEKMPTYCGYCKVVGHSRDECRKLEHRKASTKMQKLYVAKGQVSGVKTGENAGIKTADEKAVENSDNNTADVVLVVDENEEENQLHNAVKPGSIHENISSTDAGPNTNHKNNSDCSRLLS